MTTFELDLIDGHAIIRSGDDVILIDTGAPSSMHARSTLTFCSNQYPCAQAYLGLTPDALSDLVGTRITTLLGADILSRYKVLFDYRNRLIQFSQDEIRFEGQEQRISTYSGIPIVEFELNGQRLKFFLDTGARLSYLDRDLTAGLAHVGTETDFYPNVGRFETDCYLATTRIGGNSFTVKYGVLPHNIEYLLSLSAGTRGIMGFDFFNQFKVLLDLNHRLLKYAKNAE